MKRKFYFTALALLISMVSDLNGMNGSNYGMSGYDDGMGEFGEPLTKGACAEITCQYINQYVDDSSRRPETFLPYITQYLIDSSTEQIQLAPSAVPPMKSQWMPIPADLVRQLESLDESKPAITIGDTAYIYYYSNTSRDCLRSLYRSIKRVMKYLIVRKTNAGEILTCIPIRDADQKTRRSVILFPGSDESYKMDTELNLESILKAQSFASFQANVKKTASILDKIISKGPHDPVPAEFANIDTPTVGGDCLYLPEWLQVQYIGELLECLRLEYLRLGNSYFGYLYSVYNICKVCIRTLLGNHFYVNEINTLSDGEYMFTFIHNGKVPIISILSSIARYLKIILDSELSNSQKTRKAYFALVNIRRFRDRYAAAAPVAPNSEEE